MTTPASVTDPQLIAVDVIVLFRDVGRSTSRRHGHVLGPRPPLRPGTTAAGRRYVDVIDHHTGAIRTIDVDRLERDTPRLGTDGRRSCGYCIELTR